MPLDRTDRLLYPLDPADAADSALVRALLLSHGIELELGADGTFAPDELTGLLRELQRAGGVDLDVGDLDEIEADFDLTLRIDAARLHEGARAAPPDAAGAAFDGWRRTRLALDGVTLPAPVAPAPRGAATVLALIDCPLPQDVLDALVAASGASAGAATHAAAHRALDEALADVRELVASPAVNGGVSTDWRKLIGDCDIDLASPDAQVPLARVPDPASVAPAPAVEADPFDTPDAADASDGLFTISDDLPPGFEGLGGPVQRVVDLYFNDRKLGETAITVAAEELTLDAPDTVLGLLEGLEDGPENAPALLPVLQAPMRTNAHRRCLVDGDPPGCGIVETESVAALYDENELRLDLFVAPGLQSVASFDGARYLDAPERRPSALLSLGVVGSSFDGGGGGGRGGGRASVGRAGDVEDEALDVNAGLLLGYGDTHLSARADYTSRGARSRLRELLLTRHADDFEYSLGSFDWSPGAGLLDADVLGARVATSYATRVDRERVFSQDVVLYLPRRAVVQLVVDDRVYAGASYPPGNQAIDTSALPDGTYELELRIGDEGGGARTETLRYTKSASLPPRDASVVELTAGVPLFFDDPDAITAGFDADPLAGAGPDAGPVAGAGEDPASGALGPRADTLGDERFLPEAERATIVGASLARRLGDADAWRVGLLAVGSAAFGQVEYLRHGRRFSLELGATAGARDAVAGTARAAFFADGWSAGLSHASLRSDLADDDPVVLSRLLGADSDRTSVSLTKSFEDTQVGVRAERRIDREADASGITDEYGVFLRRRLFRSRGLHGFGDLEWRHDRGGEERFGAHLQLQFGRRRVRGTLHTDVDTSADGAPRYGSGVAVGIGSRPSGTLRLEAGARARTSGERVGAGVSLGVQHPLVALDASSDWSIDGDADASRSSIVSARAQVGLDAQGAAIGGVDYARAGVIVDVSGEPEGEPFDILVNGVDAGSATVGRARFVSLQPFEAYDIRLVPTGLMGNGIGDDVHAFTLFPGSVRRIGVQARREILLIGSVSDERGRPIVDALVQTRRGPALIDSSGIFQAELEPGTIATIVRDGATVCEFDVPADPGEDPIVIPERPLPCRSPATR